MGLWKEIEKFEEQGFFAITYNDGKIESIYIDPHKKPLTIDEFKQLSQTQQNQIFYEAYTLANNPCGVNRRITGKFHHQKQEY